MSFSSSMFEEMGSIFFSFLYNVQCLFSQSHHTQDCCLFKNEGWVRIIDQKAQPHCQTDSFSRKTYANRVTELWHKGMASPSLPARFHTQWKEALFQLENKRSSKLDFHKLKKCGGESETVTVKLISSISPRPGMAGRAAQRSHPRTALCLCTSG